MDDYYEDNEYYMNEYDEAETSKEYDDSKRGVPTSGGTV